MPVKRKLFMMLNSLRFCNCIFLLLFLFSCKKKDIENRLNVPEVSTLSVTAVTTNSASSGGIITNNGGNPISEKGVCIATTPSPSILNTKIISTTATDSFTVNLSNLQPNTVYYVRAYAQNVTGISYGNEINFQTSSATAIVTDTATTMYVSGGYSKKLFALNASDGSIKWEVSLPNYVLSSPIYNNGMVFVGCMDSKLYAYDTTGVLKWTANTNSVYHECPIVSNGIVYFPDANSINAFDANTGSLVWRFLGGGGNIVLKNNVVYTNNNFLYAIDATTGVEKWQYYTRTFVQPVVCDDRVYVTSSLLSFSLDVLSTSTGALLWSKSNYDVFYNLNGMNLKNGKLYCVVTASASSNTSGTNGLNVLDSATGNVLFPTANFNVLSSFSDNVTPLFADSLAFVPAEFVISVFSAMNGQFIYTIPSSTSTCGITIANNIVYFTTRNTYLQSPGTGYYAGFVYAFDYKTRTFKWFKEFRDTDFLIAAPCIVTKSGKVYRGGL
jgi:outer membrane protein assembly factor BamB